MKDSAADQQHDEVQNGESRRDEILDSLRALMVEALPAMSAEEDIHVPFLEMGANSLVLMEMQQTIENRYGVPLVISQLFEELSTIDALATYLDASLPEEVAEEEAEPAAATIPVQGTGAVPMEFPTVNPGEFSSELELIFNQQIQAASQTVSQVIAQQLAFLRDAGVAPADGASVSARPKAGELKPASSQEKPTSSETASKPQSAASPQHMLSPLEIRARGLTPEQQRHLEDLIERYTERTRASKILAEKYRSVLADSRASVGFRFTTKEMLYPIVGKRAMGARIWDVDDNEYIDITMGQGVTLFGHHPPFLEEALAAEADDVIQLGPRPPHTGEAARLIAEFTGFDRVTFTNSGTEAVMAAMRLARAATGRLKIVIFENSYHGHADATTARPQWGDGALSSVPIGGGIPPGAVEDLLILEYDSDESLEYVQVHAHELAAVMVEPVQSRRPELQPKEFLRRLRKVTEESGVLLIFDEMITGFRIHPGGAQAWFGVKADIATYGKFIGGGMPIGVVAGKAAYMDAVDGGAWQYGDTSYPQTERVGFGGTFCQHPLTMTTTLATLRYLKEQGPTLQEGLNKKTERLARTLNAYFSTTGIPIEVVYFGSLFRFAFSTNLELLFYHLMEQGVFIWEWRNYFLSTAHTDEDVDYIIRAVKTSIEKMVEGGFIIPHVDSKEEKASDGKGDSTFPLTQAQKQLWALDQISPAGSTAYSVYVTLQLEGKFHPEAMRQAIQQVVARHDALRTIIKTDAAQEVMPDQILEIPLVDFSGVQDGEAEIAAWLEETGRESFDLARGPLFRAYILKSAEEQHRLVLRGHHIVVDGLSMNAVIQEIGALYSALAQDGECALEESLQFGQYIQWRQGGVGERQENYWLEKLAGQLPVLNLPVDRPHPPFKTYRGGRQALVLDADLCQKVARLSQESGCTSFMTFFSVYALWIHRLSGQDDIIVGIPVAGRPAEPGYDKLVGYCTHLLPIRSEVNEGDDFLTYLKRMRGVLLDAYQHQNYSFADLINKLDLHRDGSHSPLVSTVFNLDRPGEAPPMAGLEVSWASVPVQFTAFDITLNLTEVADQFILECDFNRDVFDSDSIERFIGHFQTLMAGAVEAPESRVAELPLLDEEERQRLLVEWNDTRTEYPRDRCAHQLFEAQAEENPDAVAVVFEDRQLSYAELNRRANQLAHHLQNMGVGPDAVVGLCMERSLEMMVGIMGILKAGGAFLPLDPTYPPSRLGFMLEDAQVPVLLTKHAVAEKLQLRAHAAIENDRVICLDSEWDAVAALDTGNLDSSVCPENLAYIIYTSGSTGKPKGTMIVHQGLVNYLSWGTENYRMADGCGAPVLTSIGFDATITSVLAPLMTGQQVWLVSEDRSDLQEIEAIADAILSENCWSLVKITPAHLELLNALLSEEKLADQTNAIILGGEALFATSLSLWRERAPGTRLVNEYGPTETVVGCCVYEVSEGTAEEGAVAIGRPIANTQLYVLDRALQPVPVGVPGELYIGGDGVARGYLNRPELTAERFIPNPFAPGRLYKTGDLARHLPDGNLEYLGRLDSQVKIRGFRVEPGEIESLLTQHSAVRESAVVVREFSTNDVRLIAYFVADGEGAVDLDELREFLRQQLPDHMIPSAFVNMDALPLTPNGKIDRQGLPTPESLLPQARGSFVSPQTDAEKVIAREWQEALQVDRVGVDDNFFDLGGHSLLVISLRDRLADQFERDITPVDLFRYPTVVSLAKFLTAAPDAEATQETRVRELASRQKRSYQRQKTTRNRRKRHG
jgi:amino acid adenylation domain-containing protein